ncbi:uncharacterized protein LOC124369607 [Homalodisca vitripennis]|uniref:uncharacterized protein LOC124369607 n=1 Tax=Homalodisca vitripennis TaxID=197043 RepID=UPI001EEC431A|nr:uncharacterized protein LOC124369607 [Homalodisca vitripennis]
MFADDIKLFSVLNSIEDSASLQRSLDGVSRWCDENFMQLNAKKSMVMSFHRGEEFVHANYYIQGEGLQRVQVVKDLGVHLNHALSPDHHIDIICAKANRLLGLLSRTARSGLSTHSISILYKSLLRPILEYASVVWNPYYQHHIIRLERIQGRFVGLVGTTLGFLFHEVPVDDVMKQFNLCPLEVRRELADLAFLSRLINGSLDCPDLLAMINFRIPRTTRSTELFVRKYYRTNYLKNGPMARLHSVGNCVPAELDLFCTNLKTLKKKWVSLYVD